MTLSSAARVQRHREILRAAGMRPVQIWIADTRSEAFIQECRRQSLLLQHDEQEQDVLNWLDAAADRDGWE